MIGRLTSPGHIYAGARFCEIPVDTTGAGRRELSYTQTSKELMAGVGIRIVLPV